MAPLATMTECVSAFTRQSCIWQLHLHLRMLRGKSDKNILPVVSRSALMVGLIAAAGAFAPQCDARKKAGTTPPHERHPWRAASCALLTMLLVELLRTCGQVRHASSESHARQPDPRRVCAWSSLQHCVLCPGRRISVRRTSAGRACEDARIAREYSARYAARRGCVVPSGRHDDIRICRRHYDTYYIPTV